MNLCRKSAKVKGTIDKTIFRKRIISFVMVSGNNISDFHARGGAIISTLKLLTAVGRVVGALRSEAGFAGSMLN